MLSWSRGRCPERWREITSSARIAVHSVFSAFGNGEVYLPISLMAGTPSIVVRYGAIDCLPDDVVLKIEAGSNEVNAYIAAISNLLKYPRELAGRAGREFSEEFHNSDVVAGRARGDLLTRGKLRAECNDSVGCQCRARRVLSYCERLCSYFLNRRRKMRRVKGLFRRRFRI